MFMNLFVPWMGSPTHMVITLILSIISEEHNKDKPKLIFINCRVDQILFSVFQPYYEL